MHGIVLLQRGPYMPTCILEISPHVQDCQGHAPHYEEGTREALRETLYAVRHLFHEAMGPLQDSRTGQDLLPMLLQGKVVQRHLLDFSGFHTAVLWLGSSIVAAGATSHAQFCEALNVQAHIYVDRCCTSRFDKDLCVCILALFAAAHCHRHPGFDAIF